jgi:Nitroreductase family
MMAYTLTRRTAELLVETAIAAPSFHNRQPWRFVARLADRVIEIYADPARTRAGAIPGPGQCTSRAARRCSTSAWPSPRPAGSRWPACCPARATRCCSLRCGSPGPTGPGRPNAAWTAGPRPGRKRATSEVLTMRDLSPGPGGSPLPPAVFGASSQLAVISTSADDRASWLRAGQAAQRVLLLAAHRGLRAALLSPALEAPGTPAHGEPAVDGEPRR